MKHTVFIFSFCFLLLARTIYPVSVVLARDNEAGPAAQLTASLVKNKPKDTRVDKLTAYLKFHNSPLADEAKTFITEAQKNDLDWRLVPAIAGVESTFGKRIPYKSYNAWGWGIYTGQSYGIAFSTWSHGIAQVSEGIKMGYIDKGAITVSAIGKWYAASPDWARKVAYFIDSIDRFSPLDSDLIEVTL